MLHKTMEVLKS